MKVFSAAFSEFFIPELSSIPECEQRLKMESRDMVDVALVFQVIWVSHLPMLPYDCTT